MTMLLKRPSSVKGIPLEEDGDDAAVEYAKRIINRRSPLRWIELLNLAEKLRAYGGDHWISPDIKAPIGSYAFNRWTRNSNAAFPMPVDNRVKQGANNDIARLLRPKYQPKVKASRPQQNYQEAARVNKDILLYNLKMQDWPGVRDALTFDIVLGTAVVRTEYERKASDAVPTPSGEAVSCPSCNTTLSSPAIPEDTPQKFDMLHTDKLIQPPDMPGMLGMTHCPNCEDPTLLQPHEVDPQRIEKGELDPFGRPLGSLEIPGKSVIRPMSLFHLYFENGGVVEAKDCTIWGSDLIYDIDEAISRFPGAADWIRPDDPAELMKSHPMFGDVSWARLGIQAGDIYPHHVQVKEIVVEPRNSYGLELGRYIAVINDKIVPGCNTSIAEQIDDPRGGPPRLVSRISYHADVYHTQKGIAYGRSPFDDGLPLNRVLNQYLAKDQDISDRGMPFIALSEDEEIESNADASGAMNIVTFQSMQPGARLQDRIVNGQPLTGNVYQPSIERTSESIDRAMGHSAVEQGINPSGTKTAQQYHEQSEQAAQGRGPVEDRLVGLFKHAWTDMLEQEWAFRKTAAVYETEGDVNTWGARSYTGESMLGETAVEVDADASFDDSAAQSAGAQEAVQMGLVDVTDQEERDNLFKLLQLPPINQKPAIQVRRANQAWADFVRERTIPVIDESLYDAWLWSQTLGKAWMSDEGESIQRQAGWPTILPKITGWEKRMEIAENAEAPVKAIYGGHPQQEWQGIYQQGEDLRKQAEAAAAKKDQMAAAAGADPKTQIPRMPIQPLPPPPQNGFLPEAMQERVLQVMKSMLPPELTGPQAVEQAKAVVAEVGSGASPKHDAAISTDQLLSFYSVIEALRILDTRKKQAAQMGMVQPSAPGGARTPGGTEPVQGQPVIPAGGAQGAMGGTQ